MTEKQQESTDKPLMRSEKGPWNEKKEFFYSLAWKHLQSMRLLFRGGQLQSNPNPRDHWRNTVEHCLVETAIAEELGPLLGLSEDDQQKLATALSVHDWDKRIEKTKLKLEPQQERLAKEVLESIGPDQTLIDVTKPTGTDPLHKLGTQEELDLRELAFYIDNISNGSKIEKWGPRLLAAAERNPDVPAAHFDKERKLTSNIEEKIFFRLKQAGLPVASAQDVPAFLTSRIERHYKKTEGGNA